MRRAVYDVHRVPMAQEKTDHFLSLQYSHHEKVDAR